MLCYYFFFFLVAFFFFVAFFLFFAIIFSFRQIESCYILFYAGKTNCNNQLEEVLKVNCHDYTFYRPNV